MTLLVISPDYASHLYPMATLATAWRAAGERVVVATGPATDSIVGGFGFERENLQLGRGSNPGVIKAEDQPPGEDDALRGFFDATRRGAVETLAFQAGARGDDLLWNPVGVAREVHRVVDLVRPDDVIVDHLAFGARLALVAAGVRHADVVLGHPSAVVVGDEVYGYPPAWPRRFRPDPDALASLHRLCVGVRDSFTAQWNDALAVLDPGARASADAFAETGDVPVVYVSLGSFLSVRSDVLARVAEALRGLDVRVALASGSTRRVELGPVPDSWLVREALPQVTLLGRSALAVSHGGNNSVTEAMTAGVPLVLLPLSTDQFAGAAALEDAGFGEALDPNVASAVEIREAAVRLLALDGDAHTRLDRLGAALRETPGAEIARRAVSQG